MCEILVAASAAVDEENPCSLGSVVVVVVVAAAAVAVDDDNTCNLGSIVVVVAAATAAAAASSTSNDDPWFFLANGRRLSGPGDAQSFLYELII